MILSRAFNINVDGEKTAAIVPFADMPNHDNKYKQVTYEYDDELKGFIFIAE